MFSIFINTLEGKLVQFVGEMGLEDSIRLHNGFGEWSEIKKMIFSKSTLKIIHLGKKNPS